MVMTLLFVGLLQLFLGRSPILVSLSSVISLSECLNGAISAVYISQLVTWGQDFDWYHFKPPNDQPNPPIRV